MFCAALERWTGSLRLRLTLWNTAVVLLLMVVALFAIRIGLRRNLLTMLTEFMHEELSAAVEDMRRLHQKPDQMYEQLNRRAWAHPRRQLFLDVYDDTGQLVWASVHTPQLPSDYVTRAEALEPLDAGEYRLVQQRLDFSDAPPLVLRVGCAITRAEQQLASLTETLLLIGGVLLLLIPLGGYLLAGRATQPLAQMIRTTTALRPANLTERLPVRATHDELDQLAATINGFLDRIAHYLATNREFTANVAHELRSPLTAIQFSLEVALNADRSTAEYKEFLLGLLEQCGNLRTMVNQLLILAEGDAGLIGQSGTPVRLDETIRNALDMFGAVAENAGVQIEAARLEPAVIQGDGPRLWQMVNNLLDNAIKFSPQGGPVTVELLRRGAEAVLKVADTGIGIAPADLPHIFERFYQGDKSRDRRRQEHSTGLGLSICETIVTAHGGKIAAASTPGAGTTFTVVLPRVAGAPI
jgi:heavy metal sensor kinase